MSIVSSIEKKNKLFEEIKNISENPESYIQENGRKSLDCLMKLIDDAYKAHREICEAAKKERQTVASFDLRDPLRIFKDKYNKHYNSGFIGLINRILRLIQNFLRLETTKSRYKNLCRGSQNSHESFLPPPFAQETKKL